MGGGLVLRIRSDKCPHGGTWRAGGALSREEARARHVTARSPTPRDAPPPKRDCGAGQWAAKLGRMAEDARQRVNARASAAGWPPGSVWA